MRRIPYAAFALALSTLSASRGLAEVVLPYGDTIHLSKADREAERIRRKANSDYRLDCQVACNRYGQDKALETFFPRYINRYMEEYIDARLPQPHAPDKLLFPHPGHLLIETKWESEEIAAQATDECERLLCSGPAAMGPDYLLYRVLDDELRQNIFERALDRAREREAQRLREEKERDARELETRQKQAAEMRRQQSAQRQEINRERRSSEFERNIRQQRVAADASAAHAHDEWDEMRDAPSIPLRSGWGDDNDDPVDIPGPR